MKFNPFMDVDIIVNPINAKAVSGAGLAKEFAKRFPKNQEILVKTILSPGQVFPIYRNQFLKGNCAAIYNAVTKNRWRDPSKLEWIRECYQTIPNLMEKDGLKSIAICNLGCGLGGLAAKDIRPFVEEMVERLDKRFISWYTPMGNYLTELS